MHDVYGETCWSKNIYKWVKHEFAITNLSQRIDEVEILSKLATVVEGDPKAPFSIATTPKCRGGCYSFPRIVPLYP